jgi:hypothetical protein
MNVYCYFQVLTFIFLNDTSFNFTYERALGK